MRRLRISAVCIVLLLVSCMVLSGCTALLGLNYVPACQEYYEYNETIVATAQDAGNAATVLEQYRAMQAEIDNAVEFRRAVVEDGKLNLDGDALEGEIICLDYVIKVMKDEFLTIQKDLFASPCRNTFVTELGADFVAQIEGIPDERYFDNRTYSRPSTEQFTRIQELIRSLMGKRKNKMIVAYLMAAMYGEMSEMNTMNALLEINCSRNPLDTESQDERTWLSAEITEAYNDVSKLSHEVFVSPCVEFMVTAGLFTQEYVDYVLNETIIHSDDVLVKVQEEEALKDTYGSLYATAKYADCRNLLVELVSRRNEIAKAEGEENFLEYAFRYDYVRDFTTDDVLRLCSYIKESMVPLMEAMDANFDTMVDLDALRALRPNTAEVLELLDTVADLDPSLQASYDSLVKYGLYDFDISSQKENMSYTISMSKYSDAFIFMCADGSVYDYITAVHEFGHFSEAMVYDEEKENGNAQSLELSEVHSQGLELLALHKYEEYFGANAYRALEVYTLYNMLYSMCSAAAVYEYEYYLYNFDGTLVTTDMSAKYRQICAEYGVQLGSFEDLVHLYAVGGYYCSYLISAATALEIWCIDDTARQISTYVDFVSYGAVNDFGDVVTAVGLSSPFAKSTITAIAARMTTELFGEEGLPE